MNAVTPGKHISLSVKLVSLFVVVAILFLAIIGITIGRAFHAHFKESIRPHLVQYLEYIQAEIGTPPNLDKAREIKNRLPIEIQVLGLEQQWASDDQPIDLRLIDFRRQFSENGIRYEVGEYQEREYLVSHYPEYTLVFSIAHSRSRWLKNRAIPMLLLAVMLTLLYFGIRRLFYPVKQIKLGIEKIGDGDLNHRIRIKRQDELGVLAESINHMADDIKQMLDSKRQLLLAISHELRSPLTRAKVAVELLQDKAQRQEVNNELMIMDDLITELLETERLSSTHRSLNKEILSVKQLVLGLISEQFQQYPLKTDLPDVDIKCSVDGPRIKLLIKNLLDNAIKHNPSEGHAPKIALSINDHLLQIAVRDHGPGIEQQHIAQVTEPFYRADPARQRQTGGYGLGLYLCRVIAEAHGGHLNITSTPGEGTEIKVILPI